MSEMVEVTDPEAVELMVQLDAVQPGDEVCLNERARHVSIPERAVGVWLRVEGTRDRRPYPGWFTYYAGGWVFGGHCIAGVRKKVDA